ncbi:GTP 3',8-cyclase MoaA [Romboutsia sp. 1001713B170207_170306_H8]|uniref:GTP 3',8-cyclase MoaA n=1 Tax=Romboutsia sp. 1001713B170207_170306_H8 TaxID=2787112 RepID=UPI000820D1C9|nr:GTP 3',8-cyclase MoaA [Romboutsia sp. 1001713B170207_170306_H8]SCH74408.1 Molybdenum cofactor biosynthesis protein A [uncultured Clostridium sp.]
MIDQFGRNIDYLRISVTDNCNLRCIYCIDENNISFLKEDKKLTHDEIYKVAKECSNLGIRKIRITGGEPLVRKDINDLLYKLNSIDGIDEIYITTNGVLLGEKIEELYKNGLKGVNISLDSLKEDRFEKLTKFNKLNDVLISIDKAISLGIKVKINTVIVDEINKDEILDFVNLTKYMDIDIRFIELMPIGEGKKHKGIKNDEIIEIIKSNFKNIHEEKRVKSSGPAFYLKINNYKGKIGFISPISNCFCDQCNRIRLTSEGFLKKCLHYNYGVDLRKHLRSDISENELRKIIQKTIFDKPEKHLFMDLCDDKENKYMNSIGG